MIRLFFLIAIVVCFMVKLIDTQVFAKRKAPVNVPSVHVGDLRISVARLTPKSNLRGMQGVVEAWDTKKNVRIWWRQIYATKYNPALEGDVQDVFINRMILVDQMNKPMTRGAGGEGGEVGEAGGMSNRFREVIRKRVPRFLVITNERGQQFFLNLKTLAVAEIQKTKGGEK